MIRRISQAVRAMLSGGAAAAAFSVLAGSATAQETAIPGIWVSPDGCEYWVADDGWEGYMSPHLTRDGKPVCRQLDTCAVMEGDQLFATDSARVGAEGRRRLQQFFRQDGSASYVVVGHTDSRASDAYNMRLSHARAAAVAEIGRSVGARITDVRGYGERQPRATNQTAAGMQQNRRVEIICAR
ncbi:OmpA family protein [Tranquillimonas rosea]